MSPRGLGGLLLLAGGAALLGWRLLEPTADLGPLARSFHVAWVAAVTALALGGLGGWLLARRPPGATALLVLGVAPLALPPFLAGLAWVDLLGPAGRVPRWLGAAPGAGPSLLAAGHPLYTPRACGAVLGAALFPVVLLATRAALLRQDPAALEAARLARGPAGERRMALAAAAPAAVAAALLVAILALLERATPLLVLRGVPVPVQVEEVAQRFATGAGLAGAARAALPLAGLALLAAGALLVAWRRPSPRAAQGGPRPLEGRARALAPVALVLLAVPGLVVPLLSLGLQVADLVAAGGGGGAARELRTALRLGWPDALRSLSAGATTAGLALLVGLALAWPLRRARAGWDARTLGAALPAAALLVVALVPAPLIGIGLLSLLNVPRLDVVAESPVAACLLRFGCVALALLLVALRAVPREQEEAARLARRAPARVVVPQLLPAALAAALAVHVLTVTEYGASAIVASPGASLLGVFVVNEAHYGGGPALVGLLLLLLGVALAPAALLLGLRAAWRRA